MQEKELLVESYRAESSCKKFLTLERRINQYSRKDISYG